MNPVARYTAHADPRTASANLIALVVAANGPFYPIYVLALIGWNHPGAWLTMLASPLFALVPALSRQHMRAARAALPLIGIANTWWCSALLGSASDVEFFLMPCVVLPALLFDDAERPLGLAIIVLAIASLIQLTEFPFAGLLHLNTDDAAALARLNAISVATLLGFIALTLGKLLRAPAPVT